MNTLFHPPQFPSPAIRDAVRGLLAGAGYSETGLAAGLGPDVMRLPLRGRAPELRHRAAGHTALQVLVRLFLAGLPVARAEALDMLGAGGVESLRQAGLLSDAGGDVQATAGLTPAGGHVFAHDRRDAHHAGSAEFVVGPGPATRRFAELAIRRGVGATLDLGCGQGVLGILAAAHSGRVVAADVSARALAFCAFNAQLNDCGNVSVAQGDLFAPASGQRFDLILCNPPYAISPASTFLYRDGGGGICERIARAAPAHLAAGGILQMACNWAHRRGHDWQADLARWFEGTGCDAWVLRIDSFEAAAYAGVWLRQEHDDDAALAAEFDRWMAFYEREGIEAVSGGLVVMRPAVGRAPWFEVRDLPPGSGPCGESLARVLDARDFARRATGDRALLDAILMLAPDVAAVESRRATGEGWEAQKVDLCAQRGLGFAARLDPVGAALVGFLDGRRTLREAAGAFARAHGIDPEMLHAGLPALIRPLLELGLVCAAGAVTAPPGEG